MTKKREPRKCVTCGKMYTTRGKYCCSPKCAGRIISNKLVLQAIEKRGKDDKL